jgi:SagB-type dehydrogenase family enzyme
MTQTKGLLKLNPVCRVPLKEPLICQLLLDEISVELPDRRYVPLLMRLSAPTPDREAAELAAHALGVDLAEGREVVRDLLMHGVLVDANADSAREANAEFWVKRGWMEALILHLVSRNLEFEDADNPMEPLIAPARSRATLEREEPPRLWKDYPHAPTVKLPAVGMPAQVEPFEQSLMRRRCNHGPHTRTMTLEQLSTLMQFGSRGMRNRRLQMERSRASHPEYYFTKLTAEASLEIYFVAFSVDGLAPGLYHYEMRHRRVALIKRGVTRYQVASMCLGQRNASDGPCALLFTSVWQRVMYPYQHPRAYRNLLVSVAEVAQRYLLMATALDFNTFVTPQTKYLETQELLGFPHYEEGLMYVIGVG